jgi:hypothetical protein
MTAQQRIVRVRRNYNQWVANQTLEDYALRFTAKKARRWSSFSVANTAIGAVSFLALEAIGGSITVNYGFLNATSAILVVGALIFLTSIPIAYYASTYGVDIDLLTRGAGFGYIGSTVTSLIYASFTFLFFAIEAAIMSLALEMCFGVPLFAGYVLSSLIVIPLVTHGASPSSVACNSGRSRYGSSCTSFRSRISRSPTSNRLNDGPTFPGLWERRDNHSTLSCSAPPRPSCFR